eukprot:1530356-Ditylum_brightwellii.AAC.1
MYLSIQVKLIKKELAFYLRKLSADKKGKIDLGMCMVQFGMKNTLVNFQDKYYIYWGTAKGKNSTDEGITLAIGSYEPTFLTDLVTPYVFGTMGK